jgi:Fe-S-cluster-containing hydrogenase component 2
MRKFDTDVQKTKYDVLVEVIKSYDAHKTYDQIINEIPKKISPGPISEFRCCVYKERAIVQERIKLILNTDGNMKRIVQTINIACDDCPADGVYVGQFCRGCLGNMCSVVCPKQAISIVNHHAVIDKSKCIDCGKCLNVCPFQAIVRRVRPCVQGCGVDAIKMDQYKRAIIDDTKCIACGNCVYKCPFGACVDRSFIIDAINLLNDKNHRAYALVAPAIASQFTYVDVEQLATGIMQLGFHRVVEAAMGADAILEEEANE